MLATVDISASEDMILESVYNAYMKGELEVPSLPDVALKIREAMKDPFTHYGMTASSPAPWHRRSKKPHRKAPSAARGPRALPV